MDPKLKELQKKSAELAESLRLARQKVENYIDSKRYGTGKDWYPEN